MKLVYKAVSRDGKTLKGIIEAKDAQEAAAFLRSREILPISITSQKAGGDILSAIPFLKKSSTSDVVFFTRQLSSMLAAGLTLMEALRVLKEQVGNPKMQVIITSLIANIEEGMSFSTALAKHRDTFTPVYISIAKAAESSGILDQVLTKLADTLEKQQKLRGMVKGALIYPVIVMVGMVAVVVIMMIFVIPQMTDLYKSLDIELPLPTQVIIGLSSFTVNYWPLVLIGGIGIIVGYTQWHKTLIGRVIMDKIFLALPIVGKLIRQSIVSEFARIFGLLIGTGTVVIDALHESRDTITNEIYHQAIDNVTKRVEKGIPISDAFGAYPVFPPLLVQMVKIGEQTGKLDESLLRASIYYEGEVETSVKGLTTAMEPLIMIMLGLGVAFLVIAVITPIYNLLSNFS